MSQRLSISIFSHLQYNMDVKLSCLSAIKKLAAVVKVSKDDAKKWLIWHALWQIYLPTPNTFLALNSICPHQTEFTRQTFFFHTTLKGMVRARKKVYTLWQWSRLNPRPWKTHWSCKRFSKNLQMRSFEMATAASGWPWPRFHGCCHQRNGKTQTNIRRERTKIH